MNGMAQVARPEAVVAHHKRAKAGWSSGPRRLRSGLVVFGVVVMPIWILAVLIPLRPRAPDYAFTGIYWFALLAIAVAALFA
jgi:hypothetical protein